MTNLELGQKVKFIASRPVYVTTPDNQKIVTGSKIVKGEALLLAICLDAAQRKIAQIKVIETGEIYNVDFRSVNPTPKFATKFKKFTEAVTELGREGNAKSQAIINEYNAKIEKLTDDTLGLPIEL